MRRRPRRHFEAGRITVGRYRSKPGSGCTGAYQVGGLYIIASDGSGWPKELGEPAWEHVSVSLYNRCPTWEEMAFVKMGFWEPEEAVMQLHVPRSAHIDCHPYCLHLWRPIGVDIPTPPPITVGAKRGVSF